MKIEEILEKMGQENLESLFILKPENIAYVTGFKPSSTSVLILKKEPLLFSTKLDLEQAQAQSSVPVEEFKSLEELKKTFKNNLNDEIGIENSMSVGTYKKICKNFNTVPTNIIESFRASKVKN